jgi:hypothetical protein
MNQREKTRVENYLLAYPLIAQNAEAKKALELLCVDPKIGFPAGADNQRKFRMARRNRDLAVEALNASVAKG